MLAETFKALGANPVSMNFDQALTAFERGTVDGQENPIVLRDGGRAPLHDRA